MKLDDFVDLVQRLKYAYPSVFLELLDTLQEYREIGTPTWTVTGLRERIRCAAELLTSAPRLGPQHVDDLLVLRLNVLMQVQGLDLLTSVFARMVGYDLERQQMLPESDVPPSYADLTPQLEALTEHLGPNYAIGLGDVMAMARAVGRLIAVFDDSERLARMISR
jgi:hypothetical protein